MRKLSLLIVLIPLLTGAVQEVQAQQSAARVWNEQMLAAIRRNVPNPPAHARNLFHTAVAMYDAWAAYDPAAIGYLYNEKVSPLPGDIEAARAEAISYAAYRVLRSRFATGAGSTTSLASFDSKLTELGYSTVIGQGSITNGTAAAEVGKRIGQAVLTWGNQDGFSNTTFPQAYTSAVNPNMDPSLALPVLGTNLSFFDNMPLGYGIPLGTDPNFWQPLALSTSVSQNGIPQPGGIQTFVGVQSLSTKSFALTRNDSTKPWIDPFGGPSKLSRPGQPSATDAAYKDNFMDVIRKTAHLGDSDRIDISPGAIGNNPLGADTGTGRALNPITNQPYASHTPKKSDFYRVLAEFWADGPNSETPPGHWHVLANEVADDPLFVKKIKGTGPTVNALEWDVKTYFSLAGAVHDAACAAWSLKRYYSGARPITAIRYMCSKGQSTNPGGPSYDPEGIPLEADLVEVITLSSVGTAQNPGKHYQIWDVAYGTYMPGSLYLGQIAVKGWPGEDPNNLPAPSIATHQTTVKWMLGKDWLPFQRKTFNTPAFPGYVSGHSTFSRSAAEVMKRITGSEFFPGGFHDHTVVANSMQIDLGPSEPVTLQWATYYDAADQAGQSRRYGGIHPYEDDYHGRIIGAQAGEFAFTKAEKFWNGSILAETIVPTVTMTNGNAVITWPTVIGRLYKVQESTNMTTWIDSGMNIFAAGTTLSFTDLNPAPGTFYQVIETTPSVARAWNEQLLAAIRRNVPNPPAHARNLFHTAVAMYDAWAAYDTTAIGYIHHERATAGDIEAARREAISYAAYRILRSRFATGAGASTSLASFDTMLTTFGYSTATGQGAVTAGNTPAEVGRRIGQAILTWGNSDGFSNTTYPQAYTSAVNPNMDPSLALPVLGTNLNFDMNMPLGYGVPVGTDPNFWQPLALSTSVSQNGIPQPGGVQTFVGVQSLATFPFSLTRSDPTKPWVDPFGGPSRLSVSGQPSSTDAAYKDNFMDVVRKTAHLNDQNTVNISPGAMGNNPLGTDNGAGHPVNPFTNQAYAPHTPKAGDFYRVLAEFWADGPNSETPPGHWHVLANEVADDPHFVKKIRGVGPTIGDLEWDVKTYFSLAGAVHDAACAAWSLKRYYSGVRPITAIRYMCSKGQSSNPAGPAYHPEGIPLENDLVEVITLASVGTVQSPGKHYQIWDVAYGMNMPGSLYLGQIAVKGWPGEHPNNLPAPSIATNQTTVKWMLGKDWLPFQRKTFNTPAFPGYISGHSTFSRSSAEVLSLITGSMYFPGGFHDHTVTMNSMQIDEGPSADVTLQWATYYDAADEAGQTRRYGGIHPYEDDYHGRVIGSMVGKSAFALAEKYWNGSLLAEKVVPTQTFQPGGTVTITCPAQRGLYYHLESSPDLINWTPITPDAQCVETTLTFTDPTPVNGPRFYRVVYDAKSS